MSLFHCLSIGILCRETTNLSISTRLDLISPAAPTFSLLLGPLFLDRAIDHVYLPNGRLIQALRCPEIQIVLEVWKVQLNTFISGKLVFGRPLSGCLWSAVRSDYWRHSCAGHHMYNGDLLNPDRPAVWLQLHQASLSGGTSTQLLHQGRKPTSHLAVWVILTTCH
jgi:hypothetical protein